jgi:uncharacterized protein YndB with AHSA1/START domain
MKNDARIKMSKLDNMNKGLVAKTSISIDASIGKVWNAFTDLEVIKQYMFGTEVISDRKEGSSIVWKGELKGRKYEDRGMILKLKSKRLIQYSHFSPRARGQRLVACETLADVDAQANQEV